MLLVEIKTDSAAEAINEETYNNNAVVKLTKKSLLKKE